MSRFNTLLHGEPADAAAIIGGDNPPETNAELRAALTNALDRIDRLQKHAALLGLGLAELRDWARDQGYRPTE